MFAHLRFLLWPLSLLYNFIINIRNLLFDYNILNIEKFNIPIISVGNLKVGGTSKTPCVIYLNEMFGQTESIAVLSRGYGRKSKGFQEVNNTIDVHAVGDEPMHIKNKCSNAKVFVDNNRRRGIKQLCALYNDISLIILDDAFQHRYVKPDVNILLTVHNDLYINDSILPLGRLRESVGGVARADIIIVTKCPENLVESTAAEIKNSLCRTHSKRIFFSSIEYSDPFELFSNETFIIDQQAPLLLISGISDNRSFFKQAKLKFNVKDEFSFKDHVNYSKSMVMNFIDNIEPGQAIMTTEKDGVKLKYFKALFINNNVSVYVLPIKMKVMFNEENVFREAVLEKIKYNNKGL